MADVSTRNRQSAGQPTGGEFATEARSTDTGVSLGAPETEEVDAAEFDRRVDDLLRQFCEDPDGLTEAEQRRVGERTMMSNAIRIASTWREQQKRQMFPAISEQDVAQEAVTELIQMARAGKTEALRHPKSYLGRVIVHRGFEMRVESSTLTRKGMMARTKFVAAVTEYESQTGTTATGKDRRRIAEQMRAEDRAKNSGNVPATDEWWQNKSETVGSVDAVTDANADLDSEPEFGALYSDGLLSTEADDDLLDLADNVGRMDKRSREIAAYPIMAQALDLPKPVPNSVPRARIAATRETVAEAGGPRRIARQWTAGGSGDDVDALFAPFGKDLSLADRDRIAGFFASQDDQTADALWRSAMACVRNPEHMAAAQTATSQPGVSR